MGPLIAKYAVLFVGQVIDGVSVLVHATGDNAPSPAPSNALVLQILGWVAGCVATFIGGRLLHKAKPPGKTEELVPTPTEEDEEPTPASPNLGRSAGEAAARASAATTLAEMRKRTK